MVRSFRKKDFGDNHDEDEGNGIGKFREIVARRIFHRLLLEFSACLPAGTTHKSQSYPLPLY